MALQSRPDKKAPPETEKGIPLAPSAKDLKPWYSDHNSGTVRELDESRHVRELARKSVNDPLTSINHQLASRSSNGSSVVRSRPALAAPSSSSSGAPPAVARLHRESAERQRALELIKRKKRQMAGSETPSTVHGGLEEGYDDVFNRKELEEARRHRDRRWDKDHRYGGGRPARW
ncbi:uncharacterized protein FIBRA_07915 [Fibroporia radiculosa]|uniref:Uncharacterized protein n=1 Tax=Fibroporia radiculosa TaxID=599839 RepID=J4H4W2_9APHY|nr:uncharacterized protein FIBRA_07915 [Fibroporia radiculosa]CCM05684.1 predicted protein [Fibroporia radiculosa]